MPDDGRPLDRRDAIELAMTEFKTWERVLALEAYSHGPQSPKTISDGSLELGRMAYHTRKLADAGLIRKTRTVPRRGATQTFWTATAKGRRLLSQLGLDDAGA